MASKPKHPYTIVRGGKLLDLAKRRAAAADILIKGDTIAEIGRPGLFRDLSGRRILHSSVLAAGP